jgi:hypothetical protein
VNDHDQAVLDEAFGHGYRWDDPVRRQPAPLLPPGMRCTAYFYAQQSGLLTGHGDMEFLTELGWHAAVLARWHQIPPWKVNEGPLFVHTWPEWVWSTTADLLAHYAAEYGDCCPDPAGHAAWGPRGPSASYQSWRDEDAGWGPGQVPWDGDDIRPY